MKGTKWILFGAGFLVGTAGIKLLSSKDAKKAYTHCTAAVLRAKDQIQAGAATLKENCDDILADAKEINEQRAAMEDEIIEDASDLVDEAAAGAEG